MIPEQRVMRLMAWLIRNEGVEPEKIERAVASALDMQLGEEVSLTGYDDTQPMRRAFVMEQATRLLRR